MPGVWLSFDEYQGVRDVMRLTRRSIRGIAGALCVLTAAVGLTVAMDAGAVQPTVTDRISGPNRYATAAAIATRAYPTGADSVVLATGENFPDALAANGLAGALDAPILLSASKTMSADAANAIEQLDPTTVYIMGSTPSISANIAAALEEAGREVVRVAGGDRFATAAAVADAMDAIDAVGSTGNGRTAIIANGRIFADAASGSAMAYGALLPILLTDQGALPASTSAALARLEIEHVLIIGGTPSVGAAVENRLKLDGYTVQRFAGTNRYSTNALVNRYVVDEFGFDGPTAYLASGENFPDALAGGPLAGGTASPLLLTSSATLASATKTFITDFAGAIDSVVAFGGTPSVGAATLSAAAAAAVLDSNEDIDVNPSTDAAGPFSSGLLGDPLTVALDDTGSREYSISGLLPATEYQIALLDPAVVTRGGDISLVDPFTLSTLASVSIETVNDATLPVITDAPAGSMLLERKSVAGTTDEAGALRFTVDSAEAGSVIPLVYLDNLEGGTAGELDVTDDGTPLEPFGLGGAMTWLPTEAADGADTVTVAETGIENNFFVSDAGETYYYGTGDLFAVATAGGGTKTLSFAQFEDLLTVSDTIDVEYFQDQQSVFSVDVDHLSDIEDITASVVGFTSPSTYRVRIAWPAVDQPDARYIVYFDADRDGVLDAAESSGDRVYPVQAGRTSIEVTDNFATLATVQYIVVPRGGESGQIDSPDEPQFGSAPPNFVSSEVVVGNGFKVMTNGLAVRTNAGNSFANANDVWEINFTGNVSVQSGASVTVGGKVFRNNGSESTWAVSGSTITITLGVAANTNPFAYPASLTAMTGVTDVNGNAPSTPQDTQVEDGGPELMYDSTTCNAGDTVCTLRFNEPVDAATAEVPANWSFSHSGGGVSLSSIDLGADEHTVTLTFSGGLAVGDSIAPANLISAVDDKGGTASNQAAFAFVLQ